MISGQETWQGSFSAVSKPNFASKYSFESSWRDLQDLHAFARLQSQIICKFSSNKLLQIAQWKLWKFRQWNHQVFRSFRAEFNEICSKFWEISNQAVISRQFYLYSGKIWYPWNINIRTRFHIRLISRIRIRTSLFSAQTFRSMGVASVYEFPGLL